MPDDFVESNLVFDTVMLEMDTRLTCHFYNTSLRVFCGVSGHSNETMNDSLVAKCTETYYSDYIKDNFNIKEIRKNWFSEVFQVNYRQTYYTKRFILKEMWWRARKMHQSYSWKSQCGLYCKYDRPRQGS